MVWRSIYGVLIGLSMKVHAAMKKAQSLSGAADWAEGQGARV
jgi:hypothetical protein